MTTLQYPHSFGKVLLQSPYINEKVLDMVNSFTETELLEIYHIVGNQETKVQTTNGKISDFLGPNRKLSAIFTDKSFTYFYDEFNGDHTWTYWQPDLKRALKMMF